MPGRATVFRWIDCHKEFRDQYLWARNIQADYIYDEIIHIADDVVDPRTVARARLRIDTRLRQLAQCWTIPGVSLKVLGADA
jgi:hypothetical protein